jgi:hypothetical protein
MESDGYVQIGTSPTSEFSFASIEGSQPQQWPMMQHQSGPTQHSPTPPISPPETNDGEQSPTHTPEDSTSPSSATSLPHLRPRLLPNARIFSDISSHGQEFQGYPSESMKSPQAPTPPRSSAGQASSPYVTHGIAQHRPNQQRMQEAGHPRKAKTCCYCLCGVNFTRPYSRDRHIKANDPNTEPLKCLECSKEFKRTDKLQKHRRETPGHSEEQPFKVRKISQKGL